ncbi:MAG: 3-isopropylmalate dehydratase large subunit [Alphaproteobacteria bacterium MarineAlpha10_Bin3]|jgi:3-isopropylmalate/(R)-2-methylmalate dehydratase large subunit|nr:MAG: 3-isopropylmalate dehydratase large subunit [Alphaproteobacteria bacterium MarineAlpha10_Bin3]PPR70781.1 MAG: 3-isopropylmalate dehydratase large subunit [Alphaproteobacteria bacterium MarineAlpha4_Bin1]
MAKTMFEKIWDRHVVLERDDGQVLLYIDRHLCHDGSRAGFTKLKSLGLKLRRPEQTFATPDHYRPSTVKTVAQIEDPTMRGILEQLVANAAEFGIHHFGLDSGKQGIAHVVGPELGITLPGILLVCGDSHTATHGALGAFAFGIGASEVAHVMATQTLWQRKPKSMRITVDGALGFGVAAKDVILAIIGQIGTAGATGHAVEYAGSVIRDMGMEGRMTICNMTIEAGGRAGMIAPDDKTLAYCKGREFAPKGADWDAAVEYWKTLPSDADAVFDTDIAVDGDAIAPMVTWGTSPENVVPVTGAVPDPVAEPDPVKRKSLEGALAYMDLKPGTRMTDIAVDKVFIGSCTNGRIEDLRIAAKVAKGRRAAVATLIVPGSTLVKRQAEAEGLDRIFIDAGMEWRESACSMCVAQNGDYLEPGKRSASTSNRNFMGRQGEGGRTHLVGPAMAAAAAVTGRITDVRQMMEEN